MKIILFDLDGTLIDSTVAVTESFVYAFESFGKKINNIQEVIDLIGYPLDVMFVKLGIRYDEVDDYILEYKKIYHSISEEKTQFLEDANEAIKLASSFANLGIVTTKTSKSSKVLLEHLDVIKYFETIIGREDVINPKPHPEPIFKAIKNINSNYQEAWMIGDTILDMIAAKRANINAIGVMTGYGNKESLKENAHSIHINSLNAVNFIINNYKVNK